MTQPNRANGQACRVQKSAIQSAEILLPSRGIAEDIAFWTCDELSFRVDQIYPADNPQVVVLSGHGLRMRLDTAALGDAGTIRLLCQDDGGDRILTSPSGTRIEIVKADTRVAQPPTQHVFATRRLLDNAPWVIGRAGMQYRDLIPTRLGGAIIASHIRIPDAGPVPDSVHYHSIGFQLIYCYAGWVRLVYEDQGPPFILRPGDCVTQPPGIRHRVLESSEDLQVLEIGVPAEHMTSIDHDMSLPTAHYRLEREWEGQRFVHSRASDAAWTSWRIPGFVARDTGVAKGTKGLASVHVVRPDTSGKAPELATSHDADILFAFVLSGTCILHGEGYGARNLAEGDAYTLPPGHQTSLLDVSEDLRLLEVSLPADFKTTIH